VPILDRLAVTLAERLKPAGVLPETVTTKAIGAKVVCGRKVMAAAQPQHAPFLRECGDARRGRIDEVDEPPEQLVCWLGEVAAPGLPHKLFAIERNRSRDVERGGGERATQFVLARLWIHVAAQQCIIRGCHTGVLLNGVTPERRGRSIDHRRARAAGHAVGTTTEESDMKLPAQESRLKSEYQAEAAGNPMAPGATLSAGAILREIDARRETGLSRTTRYRMERRGEFPRKVRLGKNSVGYLRSEIEQWLRERERA
jgi:prophage regulatory protein